MISKILLFIFTLRYLKWQQVFYRGYYYLKGSVSYESIVSSNESSTLSINDTFKFGPSITSASSYTPCRSFSFLNIKHSFENRIDWGEPHYGKLWTYNLNYFEYLLQPEIILKDGLGLIKDYISNLSHIKDGLEPYPTSLRVINWIKFLAYNNVVDESISKALFHQTIALKKQLEFHLLGNHLLENGFALLFASFYFGDSSLYITARRIIIKELEEQILNDGGHFELSPMYHQLMLFRLLDSINLLNSNKDQNQELLPLLRSKASRMLGWLSQMTFTNGDIPLFNDCAFGINPETASLEEYAKRLDVTISELQLEDSGYRKIEKGTYEIMVDIGKIGPDYIPGHAHSDILNFVLYVNGEPIIVDTGTSTYESGKRRDIERSTASHNTVVVNDRNQSEMWGGFRVARRAYPKVITDTKGCIVASHNGYARIGVNHTRTFNFSKQSVILTDVLDGCSRTSEAYFHFHPAVKINLKDNEVDIESATMRFDGAKHVRMEEFSYACEFNRLRSSKRLRVSFDNSLVTTIHLNGE